MHISQQEKEKFLSSLSEEEFRDRVVRRLFRALGYSDGRDLCGPEEYGKDAVFVERDKFGDESITAVQTKTGSISLAGDPSKNLHTIISQLRTALDHPFVCIRTKQKKLPSVVYLAASGTVNANARGYIANDLKDPRLKFLDRDDLIGSIDQRCPEIWSNIAAEVSPYLKALADRVDELGVTVKDVTHAQSAFGAFAAASDQTFVEPILGYQDITFERRNGNVFEDVKFGEIKGSQLFKSDGVRALILGEAGSGKTTLLVRLAYMLAKNAVVATKAYRVPIFVRAVDMVGTQDGLYDTLCRKVMQSTSLSALPFSIQDFEDGRIVLLVDGLDELSEDRDRQQVVDFCLKFASDFPRCSLALATRPYSSVDRLAGLDRFKRFRISPLSVDDASKMLAKIEKSGAEVPAEWRRETLRKLEAVHGIELNPLLVTVFAVSTKIDKKDIPANITELFAKFSELMLGRWDEKKGLDQQYQAKVKDTLLSEFAFLLHQSGETTFSRERFLDFANRRLREINLTADLNVLVSEILDRSGLLRGHAELEFRHHLLQEYFAARGIPNAEYIRGVVGDDWWRNSVVFYFGANPASVDRLLDVATQNRFRDSESFIAIGLALQACYLSKMEERIEVWKWVNGAAGAALVDELSTLDEKYPITTFVARYLEARDALAMSGIEDAAFGLKGWISAGEEDDVERKTFWYVIGLCELGEFEEAKEVIFSGNVKEPLLLTAIHFGCFFARALKNYSGQKLSIINSILAHLDPVVELNRRRITAEFRGQLLEYRRGGVVALDEPEPAS